MSETYSAGIVTAYGAAVRGGYTGTYEQFCAEQAQFGANAAQVAQDRAAVEAATQTFTDETVPSAVQTVQQTGAAQVQAVEAASETEQQQIALAGAAQETRVTQAGDDQVDAVEEAGATQVGNVNTAGTTQVGAVNTAGATQVQAVEDKGQEVIDSIPDDYTELTEDVSSLKSAFDTGYLTIHHDITWQSGWIRNNGNVESSSGASTYAVVPVEKGEIVEIGTNNANMCIIGSTTAATVAVGDTVTVIQTTASSGAFETHTYEAPADMTLVLCVRASNYTLNFTKKSDALDEVEQNVADKLESLMVTSDMIDGNATVKKQLENVSVKNGFYYYRSTSATLASAVGNNAIGVIVHLSEFVGDDIEFDWDSSLNQSEQPILFAVGNTEGTTIDGYFSASEIVNASTSFQTYGGYYDSENKKVHLSLSEITTRKPNVHYLVVSMNTTILHGVYTDVPQTRKQLKWLIPSGAVPALVVASDGSGDYTTISAAVSAASDGDTIYIKDGTYTETVVINKYLHLVGQSKQGTILQQDIGDYDNCPLLITQGSVCNMTIKSLAPADTSGLTDYAYTIHLDKNFASLAKYQKCEIYNCEIYSEVNDAIGAGTNYASEYDIHDCFIHVAHNPVKAGAMGFKCHNGQYQTTGKVTLRNNIIITEDANGGSIHDILFHNGGISNTQPIEIFMVGNVLKYYHNRITNIFVPSAYNYGNSVAAMNTLS